MSVVCPTITAENPHTYREQIERVSRFAKRIHIDFADGELAPTKLVPPSQAWFPEELEADLHVMYQKPEEEIETLIALQPRAIILHAEADGDIQEFIEEIQSVGIVGGIALLQDSQPEDYANEILTAQHALIFGGKLGYHGGTADMTMLRKIEKIRQLNPDIELGWDGGVSDQNAADISLAGVEVLNVGSFVQKSDAPQEAYAIIEGKINA